MEEGPKRFSVTLELVVEGVDDQLTAEEVVHTIYQAGVDGAKELVGGAVTTWDSVSSGMLLPDSVVCQDGSGSTDMPFEDFPPYPGEDVARYYCARGHHAVTLSQLAEGRDERGTYWCAEHADPKPIEHEG